MLDPHRRRLGLAEGEPDYDDLRKRRAEGPVITVPTITLAPQAFAEAVVEVDGY